MSAQRADAASGAGPLSGVGLGLRAAFADELIERRPAEVRWLEIHPENYVGRGGRFRRFLDRARDTWRVAAHGLTLNFGNPDDLDRAWLRDLRAFLDEVDAPWYSDHLCFGAVGNAHLHDLLPMPRERWAIELAVDRIRALQDALGRDVAIENVSAYQPEAQYGMPEVEFVLEVADRADAKLLLDVNNVYVNSRNHDFDARAWLAQVPAERVVQIHVAGHLLRRDGVIIDTHAEPVCDDVYVLVEETLRQLGSVPVLLERDGNYPQLDELLAEVRALDAIWQRAVGEA